MFYQPSPRYAVEATQQLRSNVVGFQLATGERRWYIIRCYLAPNDTSTIESVVAALKERPRGSEMLVAGDLNANLDHPEGYRREEEIAAALIEAGFEYMSSHFILQQRPWCRDVRTWSMVWLGR